MHLSSSPLVKGPTVDEFNFIFNDLYGRRGEICKKIVEILAKGPAEYPEISSELNYYSSGALSGYLEDLLISGFISRDFTWSLKKEKLSNLSLPRGFACLPVLIHANGVSKELSESGYFFNMINFGELLSDECEP